MEVAEVPLVVTEMLMVVAAVVVVAEYTSISNSSAFIVTIITSIFSVTVITLIAAVITMVIVIMDSLGMVVITMGMRAVLVVHPLQEPSNGPLLEEKKE